MNLDITLWKYLEYSQNLQYVKALPNSPLPETSKPHGWVVCYLNDLEFSLPPEMAAKKTVAKNIPNCISFNDEFRSVTIVLSAVETDQLSLLELASKLKSSSKRFTLPRLRIECIQVSADDFRWSMSPEEVRWHTFCITSSSILRLRSKGFTESLFQEDMEGIIFFDEKNAFFDWQCTDNMIGGYLRFKDNSNEFDPSWIRNVCKSLKVNLRQVSKP